MILTVPPAVPLAEGPTCTRTHAQSALLSLPRNTGEQTQASPSITIKEKLAEEFQRKHSRLWFKKTSLVWFSACVQPLSSVPFSLLSEQVVGPPAAGAYRERPSKPTSFRKSYERRELPVALLHDTRGQQIAWKVGVLPFTDHAFHTRLIKVIECVIGQHLSTTRWPLMAKFLGV